jgi:Protein of unknown function (DUF3995)
MDKNRLTFYTVNAMVSIIAILLFVIFLSISLLHFYWSLGGQWAKHAAVPTRNDQSRVFTPGLLATLVVAFGLLSFALFSLTKVELLDWRVDPVIKMVGFWIITLIFLARAIGDGKYVGFLKKIRDTEFGRNDSKFYSPLCLIIAILSVMLALIDH